MQIGSEMATLQEKNPKMDPKKRFFLKNPPGFLAFEKSSSKLTSNRPFWLKQIYQDIKFILRGLPERCAPHDLASVQCMIRRRPVQGTITGFAPHLSDRGQAEG